jgi:flagella basal body P-ring formation protein FlgA
MLTKLFQNLVMVSATMAFFVLDPAIIMPSEQVTGSFARHMTQGLAKANTTPVILEEAELHQRITKAVHQAFPEQKESFAAIQSPRLSAIRTSSTAQLQVNVAGEIRGGRLPLELVLLEKEKVIRKQRVFVSIDYYVKAWVLKETFPSGHTLSLEDVHEVKVPSKNISRDTIKDPQLVVGAILRQQIKENKPLKKSMLTIPKLVKRGALVELVFKKSGIFLSAEGEALGDGKRSDIIKVKNLKSKKIVTGRVIGVNLVDVGR